MLAFLLFDPFRVVCRDRMLFRGAVAVHPYPRLVLFNPEGVEKPARKAQVS